MIRRKYEVERVGDVLTVQLSEMGIGAQIFMAACVLILMVCNVAMLWSLWHGGRPSNLCSTALMMLVAWQPEGFRKWKAVFDAGEDRILVNGREIARLSQVTSFQAHGKWIRHLTLEIAHGLPVPLLTASSASVNGDSLYAAAIQIDAFLTERAAIQRAAAGLSAGDLPVGEAARSIYERLSARPENAG